MGNTYSNCLRIAIIRGYAHYGLDANDYVESFGRPGAQQQYIPHDVYANGNSSPTTNDGATSSTNNIDLPGLPITRPVSVPTTKKPLPMLVPLAKIIESGNYPQHLLDTREWFPPRLAYGQAVNAPADDIQQLKPCKVIMDRDTANRALDFCRGPVNEIKRVDEMFNFFCDDLKAQKFTDFSLVAAKRSPNRPKEELSIKVHKFVLAAHSQKMKRILEVIHNKLLNLLKRHFF